jgi:hypothetical protein
MRQLSLAAIDSLLPLIAIVAQFHDPATDRQFAGRVHTVCDRVALCQGWYVSHRTERPFAAADPEIGAAIVEFSEQLALFELLMSGKDGILRRSSLSFLCRFSKSCATNVQSLNEALSVQSPPTVICIRSTQNVKVELRLFSSLFSAQIAGRLGGCFHVALCGNRRRSLYRVS